MDARFMRRLSVIFALALTLLVAVVAAHEHGHGHGHGHAHGHAHEPAPAGELRELRLQRSRVGYRRGLVQDHLVADAAASDLHGACRSCPAAKCGARAFLRAVLTVAFV